MKKFYEAPVVELTGFSNEDVITTSDVNTLNMDEATAANFAAGVRAYAGTDATTEIAGYGSYTW